MHDGLLLANHGAITVSSELMSAYYKMETVEHFARISVVARLLGRERLLSREEVNRLQELRGTYGIEAPAPICPEGTDGIIAGDDPSCQTLEAPRAGGDQLVDDTPLKPGQDDPKLGGEGEIRLTYRQLADLIEDAVNHLR